MPAKLSPIRPVGTTVKSAPPMRLEADGSPSRCRILLVEDHPLTRQGMKVLIARQSRFEICGEADTAPKALDLVAKLSPNVAIVDITLKSANGLELTKDIRALAPTTQVLIVSMHGENVYAERALRAGAMGYLMKDEAAENILVALDRILQGEVFVSDRIRGRMLHRFVHQRTDALISPIERLSDREMEVLRLIGNGYGTRDIASMLNLSVKTIDSYREHLKEKLSLPTSGDLVRYAIQWMKSEPC
jgi:DNA-binding NarL/FixJ family response regulator